ncbi:hypothetical protein ACFFJN_16890 [Erwinia mallotivora]|uniref:hypothetical protein n=1 Tax=Erwinia mallotivora TaxID=69222 RepID=UPI0035E7FB36
MLEHNGKFNHIIAMAITTKSPKLQKMVTDIYSQYLKEDIIKPATLLTDYGDGQGKANWSETDYYNYVLIANDQLMIIDHDNLSKMLRLSDPNEMINWDRFFLYKGNECQTPSSIDYNKLFCEDFKVFAYSYKYDIEKIRLRNILEQLNLSEYQASFFNAISGIPIQKEQKITETEKQLRLAEIFSEKMQNQKRNAASISLSPKHFNELSKNLNIENKSNKIKAQTLFCMAGIFTNLSSRRFFGTDSDSPQALRNYAYALLKKAHMLDQHVVGKKFKSCQNSLLGLENAFTCTAVAANSMIAHARTEFPSVALPLIPPVWR